MLRIRSSGWKPASAAALPASTVATRGSNIGLPMKLNQAVRMKSARMRLATGPATTTAARWATGLA